MPWLSPTGGSFLFDLLLPEVLKIRKFVLVLVIGLVLNLVATSWAHHRVIKGKAVYYSNSYAGQTMACGGKYQPYKMVAAHRSLPCGTRLRVKNRSNGKTVTVKVKDRGPYGDKDIKLDVSRRAARKLGFIGKGITPIRAVVLHD